MTQLRQRMSFALNTQLSYLQQVSLFARYFSKSPDLLGRVLRSNPDARPTSTSA